MEKNHPGIQFLKYSFFGGIAFGVDLVAFFLAGWLLFPALKADEFLVRIFGIEVDAVSDLERTKNSIICSALAFMVSNLVAYIFNVLFVFKAGRHGFWKEFGLFYMVSGTSIAIGTGFGAGLVYFFGISGLFFYLAKAVSSTLINYAGRKYFIFHG